MLALNGDVGAPSTRRMGALLGLTTELLAGSCGGNECVGAGATWALAGRS